MCAGPVVSKLSGFLYPGISVVRMSESEEEQDVPGDVGYIVSSGTGGGKGGMKREKRLASKPHGAHLYAVAGSAKPNKSAGVHTSDSAGPALREQAAAQPACEDAVRHACTSHHTGGQDSLYRADAEELSRCQTPQPDHPGGSKPSGDSQKPLSSSSAMIINMSASFSGSVGCRQHIFMRLSQPRKSLTAA